MKKIFITRQIPEIGITMLRDKGYEVNIYPKNCVIGKKTLIKALGIKQYDAVLCLLTDRIDADVFDSAPSVKIFANYADGFDNIDISEAKKRNVTITNTPGVSSLAVAEHAVSLMLALATKIVEADSYMKKGKYKGWSPMNFMGTNLSGKIIGLIGVGHIGAKTAEIMNRGFGANIIYYDLMQNTAIEKNFSAIRINTIEELLRNADFVSLHVPLLGETHNLINEERLNLMKSTAFIVNTSRGAIIDEKALVKAIRENKIAGAGLDVFEFEPKLSTGLAKLSNVILTPHIASSRESVRNDMSKMAAENIINFLETGMTKNKIV